MNTTISSIKRPAPAGFTHDAGSEVWYGPRIEGEGWSIFVSWDRLRGISYDVTTGYDMSTAQVDKLVCALRELRSRYAAYALPLDQWEAVAGHDPKPLDVAQCCDWCAERGISFASAIAVWQRLGSL